jgi:hypothetical protein
MVPVGHALFAVSIARAYRIDVDRALAERAGAFFRGGRSCSGCRKARDGGNDNNSGAEGGPEFTRFHVYLAKCAPVDGVYTRTRTKLASFHVAPE